MQNIIRAIGNGRLVICLPIIESNIPKTNKKIAVHTNTHHQYSALLDLLEKSKDRCKASVTALDSVTGLSIFHLACIIR